MMWGIQDFALSRRTARPSMDYVKEGNLIFFPEATHWVQRDAAEEANHYLVDFLLDKIRTQIYDNRLMVLPVSFIGCPQ